MYPYLENWLSCTNSKVIKCQNAFKESPREWPVTYFNEPSMQFDSNISVYRLSLHIFFLSFCILNNIVSIQIWNHRKLDKLLHTFHKPITMDGAKCIPNLVHIKIDIIRMVIEPSLQFDSMISVSTLSVHFEQYCFNSNLESS